MVTLSEMLPEQHATALRYDAASDTLTIEIGRPFHQQGPVHCQALLDTHGRLVGIDVQAGGDGGHSGLGQRLVVMLGAHEDVASQKILQARCEGAVLTVRGGRSIRAQEPNPYWKK